MGSNSRMMDLMMLICLIGSASYFYHRGETPAAPQVVATPRLAAPAQTMAGRRPAAPFDLPELAEDGVKSFHFDGKGPVLIALMASGCAECHQRVPTDTRALALCHNYGLPLWNICVYGDANQAAAIKAQFHIDADRYLADPSANVSVRTYGGSDATCWILVDNGAIVWQGGPDLAALQAALGKVATAKGVSTTSANIYSLPAPGGTGTAQFGAYRSVKPGRISLPPLPVAPGTPGVPADATPGGVRR